LFLFVFVIVCFLFSVVIVVFSFSLLFFSGKNNKMEKFTPQKEQKVVLTARDLINMDISKVSDLKFKTMNIKILAKKA